MSVLHGRAAALARKEFFIFSISPAFYGVTVFFLLFSSIWLFHFQHFLIRDTASLRAYFASFPLAFILVIPAITMKSWAEERKLSTMELLLTMPFSEWDLVLGKFAAALGVLAVMLALTVPLPLSLLPLGDFDGGVIVAEYAGALLLGSAATALGLLLSGLSRNQAGAFLGSAAVMMAAMLSNRIPLGVNLPRWLAEAVNFVSLSFHFESFSRGLLDSRDLSFFILATVLFLFLNTRVLVGRKWK